MTHPLVQHARAAAHAVRAARTRIAEHAAREKQGTAEPPLAAAPLLRSVVMGRHALGGHSDPVATLATLDGKPTPTWRDILDRLDARLTWIADALGCPPDTGRDPATRILGALPYLHPVPSPSAIAHLRDEDRWAREAVGLAPARRPLPGIACPACGLRALAVLDAGPVDAWVVVCDCRCAGAQCGCGMTVRAAGIQHIWPRAQVIGAAAGVAPTRAA